MAKLSEEEAKAEKFSFTDALDAAFEWVFNYTKLGWLFLIGIFLIVSKFMDWLGLGDTSWINVLWPFIVVIGVTLIVTLVYLLKYDVKIVVENEVEAKEWKEITAYGKRWVSSGTKRVILEIKWIKKK